MDGADINFLCIRFTMREKKSYVCDTPLRNPGVHHCTQRLQQIVVGPSRVEGC